MHTTDLLCIGLMSGTSMDGIDAVLMHSDGVAAIARVGARSLGYAREFHLLLRSAEYAVRKHKGNMDAAARAYPDLLREYLLTCNAHDAIAGVQVSLTNYLYADPQHALSLSDIITHSTMLHAQLVRELLAETATQAKTVDLVGYHGQTLYHNPAAGITIQVGDGQLLADTVGILVINDFRANDVRHGGQGAPLAPLYHQALAVKDKCYPVAVVNCGGVSNVSLITGPGENDLLGFDPGPGNALVDQLVREHTNNQELMDKDGKYGRQGKADPSLLQALKERAVAAGYLEKQPPKSLDAKDFTLIPELRAANFNDACATLEAFTAKCIVDSLDLLTIEPPKLWVLAGGGWNNPIISENLVALLQQKIGPAVVVKSADAIGWDSTYMEAEIFAYLGARSLQGLPISLPATTYAPTPLQGGRGHVPKQGLSAKSAELLRVNPGLLVALRA